MENREYEFVEKEFTRKYSSLESITVSTLQKYIAKLTQLVETEIKLSLPTKFGIVFDGWTNNYTHYVGLFAIYQTSSGTVKSPLLAISPLLNEEDRSARSHKEFIEYALSIYERNLRSVAFVVCDNENLNRNLASDFLCKPMIGCASHRLDLAVKLFNKPNEPLMTKINNLMKKLLTTKQSAKLRAKTELRPVLRCVTRWSSDFKMLDRFLELQEFIDFSDSDLLDFIPSPKELMLLKSLHSQLNDINSVSMRLQEDAANLLKVRLWFDSLVETFPVMATYLSTNASIVENADFESAIVLVLQNRVFELTPHQTSMLSSLKASIEIECEEAVEKSFADRKLAEKMAKSDTFGDLSWVPPTSNMVERLFSRAKLIVPAERSRTTPVHLEENCFLLFNADLWDLSSVCKIVTE